MRVRANKSVVSISLYFSIILLIGLLFSSCSRETGPIKIGFAGQLSGSAGTPSSVVRNGVELAVDHINAHGGINGRSIELFVEDDQGHAAGARRADSRLHDAEVVAVIGHTISEMSAAGMKFGSEHELLFISPSSSAEFLMGKDDFFFTLYPSNRQLAAAAADYAYNELRVRTVAALIDMANELYTQNYYQEFKRSFERLGGEVKANHSYNSAHNNDFSVLMHQLLLEKPDALFIAAASLDTALIAQQLYKREQALPIIGCDWAAYHELIEQGGPYVEHIYISNLYASDEIAGAYGSLFEEYRKRFREEASIGAALGYETMWLLAQALEVQPQDVNLKQTLLQNQFKGFEENLSFNATGEVQRRIYIKTIRNGKFVNVNEP